MSAGKDTQLRQSVQQISGDESGVFGAASFYKKKKQPPKKNGISNVKFIEIPTETWNFRGFVEIS